MARKPLQVRLAVLPEDEDALVELQHVAFPYHGGVIAFRKLIREDDLQTFVLTAGGTIIGSMSVRTGDQLYFMGVQTHPDYRRRGYARLLVQEVLHRCPAGTQVTLRVDAENQPAIQLYLGLGFRFTGEEQNGDLIMHRP